MSTHKGILVMSHEESPQSSEIVTIGRMTLRGSSGVRDTGETYNHQSSVAMACRADLSQARNKIAIFGDVAHLNLSLHLKFQGNPISQSFAIRLGSSWLYKPLQHYTRVIRDSCGNT